MIIVNRKREREAERPTESFFSLRLASHLTERAKNKSGSIIQLISEEFICLI